MSGRTADRSGRNGALGQAGRRHDLSRHLRSSLGSLAKAQLDIAGLVKDINTVSRSIDRLEKLIADVSEESEERDARLDARLEKMTELLLKVVGARRQWSEPRE
jgi:flagellar capping protein FliD